MMGIPMLQEIVQGVLSVLIVGGDIYAHLLVPKASTGVVDTMAGAIVAFYFGTKGASLIGKNAGVSTVESAGKTQNGGNGNGSSTLA